MPASVPDFVPVLSRGKHRSPKKGACFMEMASFLAGEKWSDRPGCTHPLLAAVARDVNDHTTDAGRSRLGWLIPTVVGLTSDDPRVDARIALACATTALPVAAAGRQNALAVGVLAAERMLAELERRPADALSPSSLATLRSVPDAARWAAALQARLGGSTSAKRFRGEQAPSIVRVAARSVADAVLPRDATTGKDELLRAMLEASIAEVEAVRGPVAAPPAGAPTWQEAVALTR